MVFCSGLWCSVVVYSEPWCSVVVYSEPWWSVVVYIEPWCSVVVYSEPWCSVVVYSEPWWSVVVYSEPWCSVVVYSGPRGSPLQTVLSEIRAWLDAHPREVVILSFSHFLGLNQELHMLLITAIRAAFATKLCPKTVRLVARGQRLAVSDSYAKHANSIIRVRLSSVCCVQR